MFFENTAKGFIIRVRLTPNSCFCKTGDIFTTPDGDDYLKISVQSPPEKGKANAELIKFLSHRLKIAKSDIEIISGELDRYKKILITCGNSNLNELISQLAAKE